MRKYLFKVTVWLLGFSAFASVQASFELPRSEMWWSAWTYKPGILSGADWILALWTAMALWSLLFARHDTKPRWTKPTSIVLCTIATYLTIGVCYNIWVYTLWKPWLYDLKIAMWIVIPATLCWQLGITRREVCRMIAVAVLLGISGQLVDYALAIEFNRYQFPSLWSVRFPRELAPIALVGCLPIAAIGSKKRVLILCSACALFEVLSAAGRLNFAYLLAFTFALGSAATLRLVKEGVFRALLLTLLIVGFYVGQYLYLDGALHNALFQEKSGGLDTRQMQFENLLLNNKRNLPLAVGKGLGSTWFEVIPTPTDVYAVGDSLGFGVEANMQEPVKFIFHTPLASMLYKFGIAGMVAIFIATITLSLEAAPSNYFAVPRPFTERWMVLSVTPYLFYCINWYGMEKDAMMCSLVLAAHCMRSSKGQDGATQAVRSKNQISGFRNGGARSAIRGHAN